MYLHVKNMVSNRCKHIVKSEIEKLGGHCSVINLGEVEISEDMSAEEQNLLNINLKKLGFAIIEERKEILIEKIKIIIIELIHHSERPLKINLSDYLSQKLNYDYTYLANLFSEDQQVTIEHFVLNHKIERAKELLIYNEFNITEIADLMHYSSVAHLSNQFKKFTGLTPSQYKQLKIKKRTPLEKV